MAKLVTPKQLEIGAERFANDRVRIEGCRAVSAEFHYDVIIDQLYEMGFALPPEGCVGFSFMHDSRRYSASIAIAPRAQLLDTLLGIDEDAVVDIEGHVLPVQTFLDPFVVYVDSLTIRGEVRDVDW